MSRGVDQLSRGTRAWLRVPTGSTICPAIRPWFPGPVGSTRCPGQLAFKSEGPRGWPAVPWVLGPGPMVRGVDELSRATRACVRGPAVSSSSPGRIVLRSDIPRGGPAFHGALGRCLMARGVDQLSWVTREGAQVPGCGTAFPRDLRLGLRAPGVDQQSRRTLARVRGRVRSTCGPGKLRQEP